MARRKVPQRDGRCGQAPVSLKPLMRWILSHRHTKLPAEARRISDVKYLRADSIHKIMRATSESVRVKTEAIIFCEEHAVTDAQGRLGYAGSGVLSARR